jgi:hypothetical protein
MDGKIAPEDSQGAVGVSNVSKGHRRSLAPGISDDKRSAFVTRPVDKGSE